MTRAKAIEPITATLPSLDEQQAMELAEVARSMVRPPIPLRLTAEELAGIERAREDFRMGRTLTSSEIRAYLTDSAAKRHPAAAGEWGTSGTRSLLRDGLIGYWLLAQGEPKFGARVIENKRDLVLANIENTLAALPKRELDPALGLYVYAITKTPFLGAYDFDDVELRAYFLLHGLQDRRAIDVADVER